MQDVWESAKKGALGSMGCFFVFLFVGGRCEHDGHGLDGGITKLDSTLNRVVGRNVDGWDVLPRKEGVDTALEHAAGKVLHDRLGL